ncbi:MEDS domain-containing protein [Amycolatopsis sp. cmx-4-61]|uniref:MEDS domain-containing protein n=1 Tax=Amycolatopsis sp. cmx-4-61 TaxID=2790937 RepID=UPI00397AF0FA
MVGLCPWYARVVRGRSRVSDAGVVGVLLAHPALFYDTPAEYLAGTVPFVIEALTVGEPVAVAVPSANLELLRRELGADAGRCACWT